MEFKEDMNMINNNMFHYRHIKMIIIIMMGMIIAKLRMWLNVVEKIKILIIIVIRRKIEMKI